MITICEPLVHGGEHIPFNAAFVAAIRHACPSETIRILAEDQHSLLIANELNKIMGPAIEIRKIPRPDRYAPLHKRWPADFALIKQLIKWLNVEASNKIFLTSVNENILAALAMLLTSSPKQKPVDVVLHGQLAEIDEKRRNPFANLLNFRNFLRIASWRQIRFIVLEEWIARNLEEALPTVSARTVVVPHPVPLGESAQNSRRLSRPFRIAFIGLATPQKGYLDYLRLAEECWIKFGKLFEFDLIGRTLPDSDTQRAIGHFSFPPSRNRLDRDVFKDRLEKADFVFLNLEKRHYGYSASGSLLDAIAFQKPIICGGSLFEEPSLNKFGPLGYFFPCSMATAELKILSDNLDITKYRDRVDSLTKMYESRKSESITEKLFEES